MVAGRPTGIWAKFREEPSAWLPLSHHSADVAAVFEAILALPIPRRRLARAGNLADLTERQIERLSFLAALHDIGKFNRGFQARASGRVGRIVGHVGPALYLFTQKPLRDRFFDAIGMDAISAWTGGLQDACEILWATICHHGKPQEPSGNLGRDVWEPMEGDPIEEIAAFRREAQAWFPHAFEPAGQSDSLPTAPLFQHVYSGLLTLADWIGSDERFFPFSERLDDDRISFARRRSMDALRSIGLDASSARTSIGDGLPSFVRTFGHAAPRPVQSAVETIPIRPGGGLHVIEAETGSGKTEAAFRWFLRLFAQGEADGIYFALPTRSAAVQIHARIAAWARRAFGDASPPVVLAVPGYLRVDDSEDGRFLAPFEVLWPDEDGERLRHRGWAAEHPKRYLAGSMVIGTVDQAILSGLSTRHAEMRASALMRLLLVIDEVHASDAYQTELIRGVLDHHLGLGGHALLLSATLGAAARTVFLGRRRDETPTLDEAVGTPYPCVTSRCGTPTGQAESRIEVRGEGRTKRVMIEILPIAGNEAEVAARAISEARRGGRVLILRNLVHDAIRTQLAVEAGLGDGVGAQAVLFQCRGTPAPHHGRFAAEDRKALDVALEERFGRTGPAGGLVVATQTVEQSLDLDFDLVLSDLAPMDVLLQRIGRLHRHDRARPLGFDEARFIAIVPEDRDLGRHILSRGDRRGAARGPHGIGTVYENLLVLEATWRLLNEHPTIEIPGMNRFLVESATHPERTLALARELGAAWVSHHTKILGVGFAQGGAARLARIRRDASFTSLDVLFPDGLDEAIRTRLGEEDRLVRIEPSFESAFGSRISHLRIPGHLVRGEPVVETAEEARVEEGRIRFRYGVVSMEYDRLGLRRADA